MTLPIVTFLAAFLLVLSLGLLLFYREQTMRRLARVVSPVRHSQDTQRRWFTLKPKASVATLVTPLEKILPRTPEEVSVVQKRLIRAGFRRENAVRVFYGLKVAVPLFLAGIATLTGVYHWSPFFVYTVSVAVGFLLPDFVLGHLIANRQYKIRTGLPDALDLMVICIEAGLGLDQTIQRVAEELKISHPVLSDELGVLLLEMRAGRSRAEAWKNLADKTDVEAVRAIVATLLQADQFGTSVSRTLRLHAETLRTRRRQQIEEEAGKIPVKLVLPLVFFIFPALFVVTLGPAIIGIIEGFERYLGG